MNDSSHIGNRQRGLSIVELLVATAVGLMLVLGIVQLMANASHTTRAIDRYGTLLENGSYALDTMTEQIRHAGFYGVYFDRDNPPPVPATMPDPCATGPSVLAGALAVPIQGYDAPTGDPPPTCLSDANHVDGTDIVVIRRVATQTVAGALVDKEIYMQSTNTQFRLDTGDGNFDLKRKDGTTAEIRKYHVHIYFLSPCTEPAGGTDCGPDADSGDPVPTLKRLELTGDSASTFFRTVPLVAGIQNMQLDYGMDTSGNGVTNLPYVTDPGSVDAWSDVMGAEIFLLARTEDIVTGYTDEKSYDLGLATPSGSLIGPFSDQYRRRVFSTAARSVNPAGRREEP